MHKYIAAIRKSSNVSESWYSRSCPLVLSVLAAVKMLALAAFTSPHLRK